MRYMVRIAVAVLVASLLAGVTLSADDDDDDRDDDRDDYRNELRIRRNRLVILGAIPDCDAHTITIYGENYGTVYVPHVVWRQPNVDHVGS